MRVIRISTCVALILTLLYYLGVKLGFGHPDPAGGFFDYFGIFYVAVSTGIACGAVWRWKALDE